MIFAVLDRRLIQLILSMSSHNRRGILAHTVRHQLNGDCLHMFISDWWRHWPASSELKVWASQHEDHAWRCRPSYGWPSFVYFHWHYTPEPTILRGALRVQQRASIAVRPRPNSMSNTFQRSRGRPRTASAVSRQNVSRLVCNSERQRRCSNLHWAMSAADWNRRVRRGGR